MDLMVVPTGNSPDSSALPPPGPDDTLTMYWFGEASSPGLNGSSLPAQIGVHARSEAAQYDRLRKMFIRSLTHFASGIGRRDIRRPSGKCREFVYDEEYQIRELLLQQIWTVTVSYNLGSSAATRTV